MRIKDLANKRLFLLAAFILAFFFLMDLFGRITELNRLGRERDQVAQDVLQLTHTVSALETEIAFANSDDAVVNWARGEGHMVLPGETLIIPIAPLNATLEPEILPTPIPSLPANWDIWWALFFGD